MLAQQPKTVLAPLLEGLADLALTLDADDTVRDAESFTSELPQRSIAAWKGRSLEDTLAGARPEHWHGVREAVVRGAAAMPVDLVHRFGEGGGELPVQYRLNPLGDGAVLAIGVDLRPSANLRQQLVNAQQALEQDYWRLRQIETRYRRLFDMLGEGVLVLDAVSLRVLEVNPRADELLHGGEKSLVGKVFPRGFDSASTRAIEELFAQIRALGRGQLHGLTLADGEQRIDVSASFLRQAGEERFLLRLAGRETAPGTRTGALFLPAALRNAPDGVALLDADGRIAAVNKAFLELAQLAGEEQALGHGLDRWLGRSGVDLNVLLANLREREAVKLFASNIVPHAGSSAQVEISACRLDEPDGPAFALFIRDVERRVTSSHPVAAKLPGSIDQVTQRVGRVPLKDLVRESTDLIEALCIETALEVTQDNRASAAELLGLSRQSLYAKLRRFKIGAVDTEGEEEPG